MGDVRSGPDDDPPWLAIAYVASPSLSSAPYCAPVPLATYAWRFGRGLNYVVVATT